MTAKEQNLVETIDRLYRLYDDENLCEEEIEGFNRHLNSLLREFNISLERYHELILERTADQVYRDS